MVDLGGWYNITRVSFRYPHYGIGSSANGPCFYDDHILLQSSPRSMGARPLFDFLLTKDYSQDFFPSAGVSPPTSISSNLWFSPVYNATSANPSFFENVRYVYLVDVGTTDYSKATCVNELEVEILGQLALLTLPLIRAR